ncbi:vWA domain-containing protein [Georgenia faecalis]|uniref:VWA domain-containing protein n=1 Tax=Georgenia faecalis TaxID=2483799 RepID=A0ABV9D7V0_9MICO|nr:vWA domain-containing protein [Georgenia faecalis]
MRRAATPRSIRPRRGARALFAGLLSLTLVTSGTSALAVGEPPPETAVEDAVTSEPTLESVVEDTAVGETATDGDETAAPPADEPAAPPADEPAAPPADVPAAEEPAAPPVEERAPPAEEAAAAGDVSVLQVPPGEPGTNEAHLLVRKGGDRTGTGSTSTTVAPLAGASFEFFRVGSVNTVSGGTSVGTCTTDGTGLCGVEVSLATGNNYFYAVETAAPGGWRVPVFWDDPTDFFRYNTGAIVRTGSAAARTVTLPRPAEQTRPGGVRTWPDVRANNVAPPVCGIDLALVMDLSNSVTDSAALLNQYKAAAVDFVDELTGTPSRVGVYTFATAAPAAGVNNTTLPLTSVATAGTASVVTAKINSLTGAPTERQGGTNWDRAFHQVVESGVEHDVVLFLTDGEPTYHRDARGSGSEASITEVEEAIHSANAVKETGSQVIVVGIGNAAGTPAAANRMSLISGPVENQDYYRTNFADLAETLEEIASQNCAGTLSVVKEVRTLAGTIVPGGPGWTFTTPTAGVTPTSVTTDTTSAVNFDVAHPAGTFATPVTVNETVNAGYTLAQQGGFNARCTTDTGASLPVTNAGTTGFTVDVGAQVIVTCTVRNAEVPPDYDELTVTKTAATYFDRDYDWEIEKLVRQPDRQEIPAGEDATFTYDVTVTPSGPIDSGYGVRGSIVVSNPNDVDFTGVNVTDSLPNGTCTVAGGTNVTVAANASLTLAYNCSVPTPAASGTNTATATWNATTFPGTAGSAQGTAAFAFASAEINVTDFEVIVTDSEFDLTDYDDGTQVGNRVQADDGPVTFTYDLTWPGVPGQCETYQNTARITDTDVSRGAGGIGVLAVDEESTETVEVCTGLDLTVAKNVVTSFDRTYLWEIDKEADETSVTIGPDGTATFDYTVTATPLEFTDSEWAMTGEITVTNPNAWLAITADVVDSVDVGGGATCTVEGGQDAVIAAGATVTFEYTCTFTSQPDYEGTNTATVTWDGDVPTPTSSAVGTADVTSDGWSQTPINETITVVDDKTNPASPVTLGTAEWNEDGTPTEFEYSLTLEGVPGECVDFTNTAWIAETDQEATEEVTVCQQAPVTATKTAEATFDRTYFWDIDKSVEDTDVTVNPDGTATYDYVVEAIPGDTEDSGWELAGEITVTNPNDFGTLTVDITDAVDVGGGATCTVSGGTDVELAAGETVTLDYSCTFTSAPATTGTNTATVAWTDADGTDQSTEAEVDVTFTLDDETDRTVDVYDDKVDLDEPELLGQATWNAAGTPTTFTYQNTHQGVGGTCTPFTNTATVDVTTGEDPTDSTTVRVCVPGEFTLDKVATGADQNADGSWTVTYDVVVTNPETFAGEYNLSDTLEYGAGITPTSAEWELEGTDVSGEWDLTAGNTTVLATGRAIAAGATHTYAVTVIAEVGTGVIGTEPGQCPDEGSTTPGGFLNLATLTANTQTLTDRDCLEPVAPTVDKEAGELVDNDDDTWTVTYRLVVDNPSDTRDLTYDISDELGFAEGVAIESATVSRDGTTFPDWDGVDETTIATGVALPAGATHTYTVTVTISLTTDIDEDDRACGVNGSNAGQGLFNEVTIVSGNDEQSAEACVPIPDPELEVDKTALGAHQNADGSWTVTYDVTVTNDNPALSASYDLTDTLEFGAGLTPTSARWERDGTADAGEWDLPGNLTAVLATDVTLPARTTHTYTVIVIAEVATGTVGSTPGQCSGEDGTAGGGFLNAATLTVDESEVVVRDCAEPAAPTVEKREGTLEANEDGTWDATYTIHVDNPSDTHDLAYDLSDDLGFAEGVVINSATISRDGTTYEEWDGDTQPVIATGVALPRGTTHVYDVLVNLSLSQAIDDEDRDCEPEDGEGSGLFNAATLVSGNDSYDDDACHPLTEPDLDLDKVATGVRQNADGSWTVTYEIIVRSTTAVGGFYDLSDTLEYGEGLTPTSAEWELEGTDASGEWDLAAGDTAVLAEDRAITGNATHTYTVTVVAEVETGVIGTEPGVCSGEDGTSGGGFLNAATITVGGEDTTDRACEEPAAPTVDKREGDLVANPDGTWDVAYTIVVDNPSDTHDLAYDLSDDLGFAEGVVINSATISRDGTTYEEWDGDTQPVIVTGEALPAGATHTYEVLVNLSLTPGVDPVDRPCVPDGGTPGSGLFNGATLTSGNDDYDDDACVEIPEPALEIDKTATGATQNDDGSWTVTYDVVVDSTTNVGTTYDLTDTLEYGQGITPTSARWELEGTDVSGTWDLAAGDTAVLAQDREIAGGATHTYAVTVVATVAPGVPGTPAGQCTGEDGTDGGGFLNSATLTVEGEDTTGRDCVEPPSWTISKSSDPASGSTVRPGDVITYTVTLQAQGTPTGVRVVDDLSDVLDDADLTGDITVSVGTAALVGDELVWQVGTFSGTATLTYQVEVDDDAWSATLVNVVTGDGDPECVGDCTTTHRTPPREAPPTVPPRTPAIPPTGADIGGLAAIGLLLALAGAVAARGRRRSHTS